jgi:NADH:quinone reductase (non-electrogenic)
MGELHRAVIIGSGFGGLTAARSLRKSPVEVTLIARTSHHLFQPLLYQVATGVLSPGAIAPATREVLRRQRNAAVLLGEVVGIDLEMRTVTSTSPVGTTTTSYDSLIVAAGAGQSYFGNNHFAEHAPGMKSIDDALELRGRIFGAFERAEVAEDPDTRKRLLTFVVIGAGPTGVEMVGQIAELAHRALLRDFRRIDTATARIVLLDAAPAVLGTFDEKLSAAAARRLEKMGVEVRLGLKVVDLDADGVTVEDPTGARRRIECYCKVWAAGVSASPLAKMLADQSDAVLDRAGRIVVQPDLTVPGYPEVSVLGDMANCADLPGVAQVAIQGAQFTARQIHRRVINRPDPSPFRYHDKGSMATVSRYYAIAEVGRLKLTGSLAWVMWLTVHLMYLVGFKNRVTTLLSWVVSFLGTGRPERTVTAQQILGRRAIERLRAAEGAGTPNRS